MRGILLKTRSVCPDCFAEIKAAYVADDSGVYLEKECPTHGSLKTLVYENADDFIELLRFFKIYQKKNPSLIKTDPHQLCVYPTDYCNLACPICSTSSNDKNSVHIGPETYKKVIGRYKNSVINLLGGEPTTYKGLQKMTAYARKHGNEVSLFSNGILIAGIKYTRWLKKIGVSSINLQYEGSKDANKRIRGKAELHNMKLKALENLKKTDMDTYLEVLLEEDINTEYIGDIISLAKKYRNIQSINFRPYFTLGSNTNRDSMTMDRMIHYADKSTRGLITNRKVILLHKFLFMFPNIFKLKFCMKHRYYFLFREGDKLVDFYRYFRLDKVEKALDRMPKLHRKSMLRSDIYFFFAVFIRSLTMKSMGFITRYMTYRVIRKFFPAYRSKVRDSFIYIDFNGRCDNHTFDLNDMCDGAVLDIDGSFSKSFNIANIDREIRFRSG